MGNNLFTSINNHSTNNRSLSSSLIDQLRYNDPNLITLDLLQSPNEMNFTLEELCNALLQNHTIQHVILIDNFTDPILLQQGQEQEHNITTTTNNNNNNNNELNHNNNNTNNELNNNNNNTNNRIQLSSSIIINSSSLSSLWSQFIISLVSIRTIQHIELLDTNIPFLSLIYIIQNIYTLRSLFINNGIHPNSIKSKNDILLLANSISIIQKKDKENDNDDNDNDYVSSSSSSLLFLEEFIFLHDFNIFFRNCCNSNNNSNNCNNNNSNNNRSSTTQQLLDPLLEALSTLPKLKTLTITNTSIIIPTTTNTNTHDESQVPSSSSSSVLVSPKSLQILFHNLAMTLQTIELTALGLTDIHIQTIANELSSICNTNTNTNNTNNNNVSSSLSILQKLILHRTPLISYNGYNYLCKMLESNTILQIIDTDIQLLQKHTHYYDSSSLSFPTTFSTTTTTTSNMTTTYNNNTSNNKNNKNKNNNINKLIVDKLNYYTYLNRNKRQQIIKKLLELEEESKEDGEIILWYYIFCYFNNDPNILFYYIREYPGIWKKK